MIKKIVFALCLLVSLVASAQEKEIDETRNFVIYLGENVSYFDSYIEYKKPVFKSSYLAVRDQKIDTKSVLFYKNGTVVYGSLLSTTGFQVLQKELSKEKLIYLKM